jgi:ABC-type transport system substrate-binding protein
MVSPKAVEEGGGRVSKKPVGTGPFEFVERVRGDHITVKKNPTTGRTGSPSSTRSSTTASTTRTSSTRTSRAASST